MEAKYIPIVMIEVKSQKSKPQAMNHKPQTLRYALKPGPKCERSLRATQNLQRNYRSAG